MRYFTSDFHFSHPSIIKYCGRNFKTVERMAEVLINQANARAKNSDDVIIHVGDFCCWGNERGIEGNKIKPEEYIKKFNATVVLLEGNHDGNNKVKSHMKCAIVDLGNTYTNVTVGHYPSHYPEAYGTYRPGTLRLCGHVHGNGAWKWYWDAKHRILNINVGIDHWKRIVSDNEIINYASKIIRKLSSDEHDYIERTGIMTKIGKIFNYEKNQKNKKHKDAFPDQMPGEDRFGDIQRVISKENTESGTRVCKKNKSQSDSVQISTSVN